MNINIDEAVEDLTKAVLDGEINSVAMSGSGLLKVLLTAILMSHPIHHELTEQMPERM